MASGVAATPDNARFLAAPWAVGLHIVGATMFCVLGAFQFSADFRRRRPVWHRKVGWGLVPSAASGLWMNAFFALPAHDGELLGALSFLFGSAMLGSLLLGLAAAMRRDFTRHRAWMLRGYALGNGRGHAGADARAVAAALRAATGAPPGAPAGDSQSRISSDRNRPKGRRTLLHHFPGRRLSRETLSVQWPRAEARG
ncbi:DUF2306 domain-containing protein [Pyxidicoccus sp. 3LFB2]